MVYILYPEYLLLLQLILLQGHLDDGPALHGNENMKLDLAVENSRLRLRLGRMERELQSLEDKFTAAQAIQSISQSIN